MLRRMSLNIVPADIGNELTPVKLSNEGRKRAMVICHHVSKMVALFLASDLAGVPYSTTRLWRQRSPEFQSMLADAEERRTQLLEAEAWRRGIGGSDLMLIFMLKASKPAIYRESWKVEMTGPDGAALELSDPQRAARIAALLMAMRDKHKDAQAKGETIDAEYREVPTPRDDCDDLL